MSGVGPTCHIEEIRRDQQVGDANNQKHQAWTVVAINAEPPDLHVDRLERCPKGRAHHNACDGTTGQGRGAGGLMLRWNFRGHEGLLDGLTRTIVKAGKEARNQYDVRGSRTQISCNRVKEG